MKKIIMLVFVSLFFLLVMLPLSKESTCFSETTIHTLYVNPSTNYVSVGNTFVINVSLADYVWLQNFEFYLGYNTIILDGLNAWVHPPYVTPVEPQINDTEGYVHVIAAYEGPIPSSASASESFPLASITFKATALGSSILDLYDTLLFGFLGTYIEHVTVDGSVTVSSGIITVPDDYPTIQEAINAASDGDTIFVRADTYYEHIIVNKTVSLVGERRETTIIDGGGYGTVVRIWADGVKISNFTIRNIGPTSPELPPPMDGISAHFSNGKISNNIIEHNGDGIALVFSTNNTITGNKVSENEYGIRLDDSNNNTIASNDVSSNKKHGIYLEWDSNNNAITDNKVSENEYGIYFDHSSNNALTDNEVSNNDYGIHFYHSPENIIVRNEVLNNENGIYLDNSRLNSIHHNNFINNTCQAYSFNSYNAWDEGYPSGGNYWSDYNGTDSDSDGIGDTPYSIDGDNQDNYPLMGIFCDFPISSIDGYGLEETFHMSIICNSTVTNFGRLSPIINLENGEWAGGVFALNVTGFEGTKGFCRFTIPKDLLDSGYAGWSVYVNGTNVTSSCNIWDNSTHTFIYVPYNHSIQQIMVEGWWIVPEFPTWTFMLLILLMLTVAIALYKQRLLKTPIH